jgi:hypothetical protein
MMSLDCFNLPDLSAALGFYIPEAGIIHSHRRENLNFI